MQECKFRKFKNKYYKGDNMTNLNALRQFMRSTRRKYITSYDAAYMAGVLNMSTLASQSHDFWPYDEIFVTRGDGKRVKVKRYIWAGI